MDNYCVSNTQDLYKYMDNHCVSNMQDLYKYIHNRYVCTYLLYHLLQCILNLIDKNGKRICMRTKLKLPDSFVEGAVTLKKIRTKTNVFKGTPESAVLTVI